MLLKLDGEKDKFPLQDMADLMTHCSLERYIGLMVKHIDLVERRILKGEKIAHEEKMMSIFEPYTEWAVKGKSRPQVESGKKVSITGDQFDLIVYHRVMDNEQDRDIVAAIADEVLKRHKRIASMSFDKGHWGADNKELLELEIPGVVLPKLGKRTAQETQREERGIFKRPINKHSAVESNINELEHRGLDRCPDRGYPHLKTYVAPGVCAYNLKKIGKKILSGQLPELLHPTKAA